MVNILEHNHIQGSILLNSVSQNLDYDHAIYHESDTIGPNRHNLSIDGVFSKIIQVMLVLVFIVAGMKKTVTQMSL